MQGTVALWSNLSCIRSGDPRFESRRETEIFFILSNRREEKKLRKMMPRISSRPESDRDRKQKRSHGFSTNVINLTNV